MPEGLLLAALKEPDPVFIFEHAMLYPLEGESDDGTPMRIGRAALRRRGQDVTLITYGGALGKTLQAAEVLAAERIDAEVIDLRTLRPLDTETILASVSHTHRAVIVDEAWRTGGFAAEVSARSWKARSMRSTRRWRACAAPKCRCPTPSTSRTRRCRRPRRSSAPRDRSSRVETMAQFLMPKLGADMTEGKVVEW